MLDNYITNLNYKHKYLLNTNITIDDLKIFIDDKINIKLNDNLFCVYDIRIDKNNYLNCDFIYLFNNKEDIDITLNNNMKILFYNEYSKFNTKFLTNLYTTWIDTYIITSEEYTTLKLTKTKYEIKNYVK